VSKHAEAIELARRAYVDALTNNPEMASAKYAELARLVDEAKRAQYARRSS